MDRCVARLTKPLDGNQIDFHGKARMDAKLSHMVVESDSVETGGPIFQQEWRRN